MKIAIDISPLKSAHQFRGVGVYTKRLIESLKKHDKKNKYLFIRHPSSVIRHQADIIHYPYFDLFWLTLPLKKQKPTVVTVHDLIPLVFPEKFPKGLRGRIKYQIQKQSLRGAKAIITDSNNSKKDIVRFIGFPKEKIHVVYLAPGEEFKKLEIGISKKSREASNWKLEIKEKYQLPETFLLYVGDVNYSKNIPGLIKAFAKIQETRDNRQQRAGLVLVGKVFLDKNLKETKEILQLIKVLKLNDFVRILGFVPDEDLPAIYNLATVYCQPSFYEGFGLPVLEAMACGTPVVVANTSSLPEICGGAAIMVDPNKVDEIAEGIKKVIDDKILRGELAKKGLDQAKKFTWEKTAKETIKVYEKIYQQKN